jgi:hypothetical protein
MGSKQGGLFCAIVQLMTKTIAFVLFLAAGSAAAQQPTGKSDDQQARAYIASAFMTGAAPMILSDDVVIQPELRARLKIPADANSRTVYQALVNVTSGKMLVVRPAIRDEVLKSQALPAANRPIFAIEAGDSTLVVQYDLDRDNIAFVGQPAAIAVTQPVTTPAAPQQVTETPAQTAQAPTPAAEPPAAAPVAAPAAAPEQPAAPAAQTPAAETPPPAPAAEAPAPAPAAETPAPAPAAETPTTTPAPAPAAETPPAAPAAPVAAPAAEPQQARQYVEPQVPREPTKGGGAQPARAQPTRAAATPPPAPRLKPTGPCEIKPVMSDQDLVNCGATPHYGEGD